MSIYRNLFYTCVFPDEENKRNSYEDRSAQKNGAAHSKDATRPAPTKPQQACGNTNAEDRNKSPDNDNRSSGAGRPKKTTTQSSSTKTSSSSNKPKASTHGGETACSSAASKKKSSPASASDQELEDDSTSSTSKSSSSGCFLYNICKNESSSANKANSNGRKSAQSKQTVPGTGSAAASSSSGSGGGTRAGASKSERFTAYLHRRQQRSARQKSGYDLILKVLEKWLELVLRFALWLFDLVSDVVILSGSMLWDGSKFVFEYAKHLYEVARTELRQNSGKPTAICKAWLLQFDRQFAVDSRWAVWRRFVKKQVPATEQVRCGRLPTTGDEAMYSLLNCKGKDAYRYLHQSKYKERTSHFNKRLLFFFFFFFRLVFLEWLPIARKNSCANIIRKSRCSCIRTRTSKLAPKKRSRFCNDRSS